MVKGVKNNRDGKLLADGQDIFSVIARVIILNNQPFLNSMFKLRVLVFKAFHCGWLVTIDASDVQDYFAGAVHLERVKKVTVVFKVSYGILDNMCVR